MGTPVLLIVEDDPQLRELICESLEMVEARIVTAFDGQDALEKSLLFSKDLVAVLSDIKMPRMSGIEFLRKLREQHIDVPFVVFSAYGDKLSVIEALRYGAMDFLDKPVDIKHLRSVILRALDLGIKMRELDQATDQSTDKKITSAKKILEMIRYDVHSHKKNRQGKAG